MSAPHDARVVRTLELVARDEAIRRRLPGSSARRHYGRHLILRVTVAYLTARTFLYDVYFVHEPLPQITLVALILLGLAGSI